MRVIPQHQAGHYHVESATKEGVVYDVDVLAYEGEGHCTCPDWMNRIGPCLDAGTIPPRRFCIHLLEARDHFTDAIIARTLQNMRAAGPG